MERKYFLGANTAEGVIHFYGELVDAYELKKLYIIKGGSGIGKSTFIRKFATAFLPKHSVDWFFCSGDPQSLDGAVITDLGIGIVDGTAPHMIDPKYPGVVDEIINLGQCIEEEKLKEKNKNMKEKIARIQAKKQEHYKAAFASLGAARGCHMELEELYKDCVDFDRVNLMLKEVLSRHGL